MAKVTVNGLGGLVGTLAQVRAAITRGFQAQVFPAFERILPQAQQRWWDQRFGQALIHSRKTVRQRSSALLGGMDPNYYGRNRPGRRAKPSSPYYEWTGAMRRSTSRFTEIRTDKAVIDTGKNYRGPLNRLRDPVQVIMVRRGIRPWDERTLNIRLERIVKGFSDTVARQRFGR